MNGNSAVITDKVKWTDYIEKSFEHDFYHTWFYHSINTKGTPMLFVYEEQNDFIALPMIQRAIKDSCMFDMTSVYGYSGPVSNKKFEEFDDQQIKNFECSFREFVEKEKIVSVFSRLHPFLNQNLFLDKIGGIRENGKTIFMDLTIPLEEQRENYHKRLFRQIKQLRKKDYLIKETESQDDIKIFTRMYTENMDRLSASQDYYFDEEYFTKILKTREFNCKLIMIYDGEEATCGAIVGCSKNIIRNHLSATNENYIKDSPSKLLTDEISLIGRNLGMKYFHLGGGVGGRNDSLFTFKSYFSSQYLEDYIWCYIADEQKYESLLKERDISSYNAFFPLYRSGS